MVGREIIEPAIYFVKPFRNSFQKNIDLFVAFLFSSEFF